MKTETSNDRHMQYMRTCSSSIAPVTYERQRAEKGASPRQPLVKKRDHSSGARESVAADRLVSARPESRQTTDLTDPWRREGQSNALNWQPGAAALFQGPQKTSNAKRLLQRLARDKGARQFEWNRSRRTLGLQRPGAEAQSDASGCPIAKNKKETA